MSETPLSERDERDLEMLGVDTENITQRSLLTVWSELLSSVDAVKGEPMPVQVAAKVVASWPFLTFQDTATYHLAYHDLIIELRQILRDIIKKHPGATGFTGDDDVAENHEIYRDILVGWHIALDKHEKDWRAEDPQSHIQVAIIADARAFFFSQLGLAGHLDAIGFSLTDGEFLDAVKAALEVQGE